LISKIAARLDVEAREEEREREHIAVVPTLRFPRHSKGRGLAEDIPLKKCEIDTNDVRSWKPTGRKRSVS
jgi:hypothetical protein